LIVLKNSDKNHDKTPYNHEMIKHHTTDDKTMIKNTNHGKIMTDDKTPYNQNFSYLPPTGFGCAQRVLHQGGCNWGGKRGGRKNSTTSHQQNQQGSNIR
jgi:hypothetical protein